MIWSAKSFVESLAAARFENVFNPYSDVCAVHDLPDAPTLRRRNLVGYLDAVERSDVDTIWVGRDLGYRGGRRTGVALTDEVHFPLLRQTYRGVSIWQATSTAPVAELTARYIWRMINLISSPPLLWNVFPLHPHEVGDPMSNRSHTKKEADETREFISTLVGWIKPRKIVAIGKDARTALAHMGFNPVCVRHPSYGGQTEFASAISELYGIDRWRVPIQLPLRKAETAS